jgi:hypothetical protein
MRQAMRITGLIIMGSFIRIVIAPAVNGVTGALVILGSGAVMWVCWNLFMNMVCGPEQAIAASVPTPHPYPLVNGYRTCCGTHMNDRCAPDCHVSHPQKEVQEVQS